MFPVMKLKIEAYLENDVVAYETQKERVIAEIIMIFPEFLIVVLKMKIRYKCKTF